MHITYAYENTSDGSVIRKWLVEMYAWRVPRSYTKDLGDRLPRAFLADVAWVALEEVPYRDKAEFGKGLPRYLEDKIGFRGS